MKTDTPRTQYAADHSWSGLELAEQLERELNERNALIRELLTYNLPGDMHEKLMRVAEPSNGA